jgi:hypothetical protein
MPEDNIHLPYLALTLYELLAAKSHPSRVRVAESENPRFVVDLCSLAISG